MEKGEVVGGTKKLSEMVKDCLSRWFQETLEGAQEGDARMKVLVSQMYFNGYGTSKDPLKGKFWMKQASRCKRSAQAGYGASDSDSQ